MPTKSNNTGGVGGKRQGAGRKKKPVTEKLAAAHPGSKKITVLDIPEVSGVDMPKPHEFLSSEQRDGKSLQAKEIYTETWKWLKGIGCSAVVSPQLLERYSMCAARWIQCEETTSALGYLSKHPTTGKPIPSPFINIGINYMKHDDTFYPVIYGAERDEDWTDPKVWKKANPSLGITVGMDKVKAACESAKIDGAVATVMALDRAIRCGNDTGVSVYDNRGLLVL